MLRVRFMMAVTLLSAAINLFSQARVMPGSKVYIDKMENGLDGFIAAEILKQKLPISVVTDESPPTSSLRAAR